MRVRISLILCVSFPMMMSCVGKTVSHTSVNNRDESSRVKVDPGRICLAQSDILNTLQRLSSATSQSEADEATEPLISETARSPECRRQVIAVIMRAMDQPNLDFTGKPALFELWYQGSKFLGDVKATEALDLLISHLQSNNGVFSTSMSHHPALQGVIKMGPIAIPKLSAVLKDSPDPDMRRYAVYCIAGIGGAEAKRALEQALPSEADHCVSRFIRVSIDTINVKSGGLKNDTVRWFMAFQCHD